MLKRVSNVLLIWAVAFSLFSAMPLMAVAEENEYKSKFDFYVSRASAEGLTPPD